ncbi:hypothetical protein CHUAL_004662 [Chamberlinius hualienensis]
MQCKCTNRTRPVFNSTLLQSACDSYSTQRGANQSVVTYSFFGAVGSPYFRGIALNAKLIPEKYPGWLMRVYHNMNISNSSVTDVLCPLWCQFHHLDFCQAGNLPPPLRSQSNIDPRVWRFNVLGDPLVSRFMSRDLDSLITDREVAAVNEWLKSGKKWHFMHDHPYHIAAILAGMWGGLNRNLTQMSQLRQSLLTIGRPPVYPYEDQTMLRDVIIPVAEKDGDYVNHDSYLCQMLEVKNFQPWPVKRKSVYEFVGSAILRHNKSLPTTCPVKCRPKNHRDWYYC